MRFWLKWLLPLLAGTLVVLSATTALAGAPRCDSRGAITFGKPPLLEEPKLSVDVDGAPTCLDVLLSNEAYERGRAPHVEPQGSLDALPAVPGSRPPTTSCDAATPLSRAAGNPRAELDRIERPPRG